MDCCGYISVNGLHLQHQQIQYAIAKHCKSGLLRPYFQCCVHLLGSQNSRLVLDEFLASAVDDATVNDASRAETNFIRNCTSKTFSFLRESMS
ncbi:hypothetical protein PsorP6_000011 [Peronosclerospora sorghi]|uniref:Uncharacterized protein n=1 Tax=Peronosclerospora sorghi TaxID=230839 RepID=A0ACC0WVP4_9STRA|nr:hypothetical protein PsorP6_000011 [Peronosclerospora sorghi]